MTNILRNLISLKQRSLLINKSYLMIFVLCIILCACSTNKRLKSKINHTETTTSNKYLIKTFKDLSSNSFEGRKIGSQGNIKAQVYIKSALLNLHVKPFKQKYLHSFSKQKLFTNITGTNVIGLVEGTTFKDKYIVLSAHYDHLGIKGHVIYNGADDNASGTAALLALAKKIKINPLKHSVIFLFTDGEESGLYGSKEFINNEKKLLAHLRININLDMIAGAQQTKTLHYIEKRLKNIVSEQAYKKFKNSNKAINIKIKRGFHQLGKTGLASGSRINYVSASDHGSFNRAKIPFVYYGVGTHINYHTKNDDFDHANIKFFLSAFNFIENKIFFLDRNIFK